MRTVVDALTITCLLCLFFAAAAGFVYLMWLIPSPICWPVYIFLAIFATVYLCLANEESR